MSACTSAQGRHGGGPHRRRRAHRGVPRPSSVGVPLLPRTAGTAAPPRHRLHRRASPRSPRRSSSTARARASAARCSSATTPTPSAPLRPPRSRCSRATGCACSRTPRRVRAHPVPVRAIIVWNLAGDEVADGIVITPSHNPRATAAKYNPARRPRRLGRDGWIAARANEQLAGQHGRAPRVYRSEGPDSSAPTSTTCRTSSTSTRSAAGVRIGADRSAGRASRTGPRSATATGSASPSSIPRSTRAGRS